MVAPIIVLDGVGVSVVGVRVGGVGGGGGGRVTVLLLLADERLLFVELSLVDFCAADALIVQAPRLQRTIILTSTDL